MSEERERQSPSDEVSQRVEELEKTIQGLRKDVITREIFLPRAISTLVSEWDKGEERRRAAFFGLIGSTYFFFQRRALVIVFGGVVSLVIAIIQIYILWNQNTILENQNRLISEQSQRQADEHIDQLISSLDEGNEVSLTATMKRLGDVGGFDALFEVASGRAPETVRIAALVELSERAIEYDASQILALLRHFQMTGRPASFESLKKLDRGRGHFDYFSYGRTLQDFLEAVNSRLRDDESFKLELRRRASDPHSGFSRLIADLFVSSAVEIALNIAYEESDQRAQRQPSRSYSDGRFTEEPHWWKTLHELCMYVSGREPQDPDLKSSSSLFRSLQNRVQEYGILLDGTGYSGVKERELAYKFQVEIEEWLFPR